MNRYILIPEDTIRVLPPEDGFGAAIEIFCSRTVIYFEIGEIESVCLMNRVRAGGQLTDAFCFTAADRLLEFLRQLRTYAPDTLDFTAEADYIPESCDHNGHHHG